MSATTMTTTTRTKNSVQDANRKPPTIPALDRAGGGGDDGGNVGIPTRSSTRANLSRSLSASQPRVDPLKRNGSSGSITINNQTTSLVRYSPNEPIKHHSMPLLSNGEDLEDSPGAYQSNVVESMTRKSTKAKAISKLKSRLPFGNHELNGDVEENLDPARVAALTRRYHSIMIVSVALIFITQLICATSWVHDDNNQQMNRALSSLEHLVVVPPSASSQQHEQDQPNQPASQPTKFQVAMLAQKESIFSNSSAEATAVASPSTPLEPHYGGLFTEEQAQRNANNIRAWKQIFKQTCRSSDAQDVEEAAISEERKLRAHEDGEDKREPVDPEMEALVDVFFQPMAEEPVFSTGLRGSTNETTLADEPLAIEPCKFVFLDLGANVGDTLGHFIDLGMWSAASFVPGSSASDMCPARHLAGVRYERDSGKLQIAQQQDNDAKNKRFFRLLQRHMYETSRQQNLVGLGPEDYCYFGVEGNPTFTKQLEDLQERVMHSYPRPVRRAHFWTETVATHVDGPTELYLDTVNHEQNYWGSSLFSTHKDVQKSPSSQTAPVTGKTLTSMLKETVIYKHGSHVMIKMDIEGAEYASINEAYDSGILCQLVEKAVRVDMLVELHNEELTGDNPEAKRYHDTVHKELQRCGVNMWTGRDAG